MIFRINRIHQIGYVFLKEILRSYQFMGCVFIVGLLFLGIYMVQFLVSGALHHTVQTGAFWVVGISGLIFTLAVGANSLGRDIEKKAYFIVLVRPIGRVDLFLGRAWGMGLFLSFLFFITTFIGIKK